MNNVHFNKLTPAEAERLALLMEECAEVQQIIGKILRHGYESCHPFDRKKDPTTNKENLEKELGDVSAALALLIQAGDVTIRNVTKFRADKLKRVGKYLHHNKVLVCDA